ncbi:MAG: hypothetical protein U0359_25250 [Byssovorax sp.]
MQVPESAEPPERGLFYRFRVAFLLIVLAGVLLYAWKDIHRRRLRTEWKRPLRVAFVVVRDGPVTAEAIAELGARVPALTARLGEEMERYRSVVQRPFEITLFGPVDGAGPPPEPPADEGLVTSARYQWKVDRWIARVDASGGFVTKGFDTRIYLHARPPLTAERKQIEGTSEQGGRTGVVSVELDASMADFTLFVATHELFHTLGASDKYALDGSVLEPDGLAEPDRSPRYPQRFAEVMARHRPLSATRSSPPSSLAELAVGATTAAEIGWRK